MDVVPVVDYRDVMEPRLHTRTGSNGAARPGTPVALRAPMPLGGEAIRR